VPDTVQAKEAVLETYIPQTATVKRSEAKVDVTYDGNPKFAKIDGTDMHYAVNTSFSVIRYGSQFYCCDNGVWFMSGYATGPWEVCVAVPQAIYTIPPSCPIYNVKYVHVYKSTPDVVYVGYTPGYTGCYVYGGTVVYGTGYVYPGWHGTVYYPAPVTYGYAAAYRPSSGWAFAGGVATGLIIANNWDGGWWGARGYGDVDIDVNRNTNINRNNNNLYDRRGDGTRGPGSDRRGDVAGRRGDGTRGPGSDRRGDAARGPGADRRGDAARKPGSGSPGGRKPVTTQGGKNNVFADRNGNVHRKTDKGWQQKTGSGWSDKRASTAGKPSSRPSTSDRSRSNLDRHNSSRQRGSTRSNNFQNSRNSSSRNRSSGSSRGSRSSGRSSGGSRGRSSGGRSRGGGGRR
jgi:hypothetical protein